MAGTGRNTKHLGHIFLDCMQQSPDAICQIDAATGEQETNASVLSRSIRLAKCLRNFGLNTGDVLCLGGWNHLDLYIPYYAALLNGLPICGVDPYFKLDEIKTLLKITRPKIAFCQQDSYDNYVKAAEDVGLDTKIITFDGTDNNMEKFQNAYDNNDSSNEIEPRSLDTKKAYAFLISTSGTTGGVKVAAFTHDVIIGKVHMFRSLVPRKESEDNVVFSNTLHLSPIQWVTAILQGVTLHLSKQTRLQTSKPDDIDHIIEMINKYKPTSGLLSPSLLASLIPRKDEVDVTCFSVVNVTGSRASPDVMVQFKAMLREDARVFEPYGLTETIGPITFPVPGTPPGSCGQVVLPHVVKLVDSDSGMEITEPLIPGELWTKGPGFTEYYNDPDATAASFTSDGFFKSGDLLYRDEKNFYFFVDRIKSLIKYRNSHVLPAELEDVILTHPSVRAVSVCGVKSLQDGQRAAACVVRKPGCHVSETEIKELVASKLSKNKQLHGGVVFVDELPMTSNGKIARAKVLALLQKCVEQSTI